MVDNNQDPIIIPLTLDATALLKDLAAAARVAQNLDDDLTDLLTTVNALKTALKGLSGGDISISVSTSDLENAESLVQRLDGEAVDITVNADFSDLLAADRTASELDSLAPDVTVSTTDTEVDTTTGKVETLDGMTVDIPVTADASPAETEIASVDDSIPSVDIPVDADTTQAKAEVGPDSQVAKDLNALKRLAVINLIIDATKAIGGVQGFIDSTPVLNSITDMNDAVRSFEAKTRTSFDGIEDVISSTFDEGLADSRQQVADTAAQLTQLGVPSEDLADATKAAFNAAVVTGKPVEEILKAQDSIVKNLGGSYSDAADLIVTGYQQGADKGGDFLSLLTEFGPQFKALGIDGSNALNLITQASEGGAGKVQRLGDIFKELNKKITEAIGTKSGPAFDALQELGLYDQAKAVQAGTMTGTDFAQAAIDAAATKGKRGDNLLTQIFGEPVAEFGLDLFKGFDFSASDALIPQDAAQTAANTLTDSLGGAVKELSRTIEDELAGSFRIAGQPLTEVLDDAKVKVQQLADLLQSGKGIPEALEIVLEAPGLANDIGRFEASIGNFIIDLELTLASILDALGKGDVAAGIRSGVATQAKGQFAYDIKVANPDEIQGVIARAVSRGVDQGDISEALTTATTELISQGDVDRAQAIVQKVNELPNAFIKVQDLNKGLIDLPFSVDPNAGAEAIAKAKDEAIALYEQQTGDELTYTLGDVQFTPTVDTTAAHAAVDEALTIIDSGMQKLKAPVDIVAKPFQEIIDAINSPGGQNMVINAAANSTFAAGQQRMSGGIDFSDPANTLYPPEYVEGAQDAITEIADTSTEQLGYVQTSAKDTAVQLDTVVVATDNLQMLGGDKLTAFANVAVTAAGVANAAWAGFVSTLANVGSTIPGGLPDGAGRANSDTQSSSDIPGYAGGGHYNAGDLMVTGEDGPELQIPESAGYIVDADTTAMIMELVNALSGMNGGVTNNITTNNSYGINSHFNTQNQAQAVGASAALSRQIRSFKQ